MSSKRALKRKRANERRKMLVEQQKKLREKLKEVKDKPKEEEIEYITESLPEGEEFSTFKKAFDRFSALSPSETPEISSKIEPAVDPNAAANFPIPMQNGVVKMMANPKLLSETETATDLDENTESDSEDDKPRISNKKRKLRDRLSIAQLKQVVERPDLVELHDPNSSDPVLLVHLKSSRNTVSVPSHWQEKRRYLQGKRGYEKASFVLPKAIQDTGVSELRNPGKLVTLKQKQRQRMNPRLGRLDVDYQKLHAAFFRHMEKPPMTTHGEIYYSGKENEIKYKKHSPGKLSKRLKNALHMMDGYPPPYLINMQRFGPPPSYSELKIPGLNAPIPPGCKYGYSEGQWGKPPVDDRGYPKYGDPFGINSVYEEDDNINSIAFQWGKIEENVAYDDEVEDEEMEEDAEEKEGEVEDAAANGGEENGETSIEPKVTGLTTPEVLNLRKNIGVDTPENPMLYEKPKDTSKQLYQVLDKKDSSVSEKGAMGSSHTYNIVAEENKERAKMDNSNKVSVALNEEEMGNLDEMTIRLKYEQEMQLKSKSQASAKADLNLTKEAPKRKKGRRKKKDEMDSFKF